MKVDANYELMRDIEQRYRSTTGLKNRDYYSIFYGPLRPSRLLMINANPGGSPDNYRIVDVMRGEHEYIEGRSSGPTTRNGAIVLHHIAGSDNPESIRGVQVLNRFFRRSPGVEKRTERQFTEEARPFLKELINFIGPEAILFGGDAGVRVFASAHGARLTSGESILGPNGSSDAVYYREYKMELPYYRPVPAFGIYHPSKMNRVFRERVFPLLRERLGPLV